MMPATLTIRNYILTPKICYVERKSLLELISSFNSGRLCVLQVIEHFPLNPVPFLGVRSASLCFHYKHPTILIEFEEDKAFTLDVRPIL
jgi:DNA excision repair protein ERCC-4